MRFTPCCCFACSAVSATLLNRQKPSPRSCMYAVTQVSCTQPYAFSMMSWRPHKHVGVVHLSSNHSIDCFQTCSQKHMSGDHRPLLHSHAPTALQAISNEPGPNGAYPASPPLPALSCLMRATYWRVWNRHSSSSVAARDLIGTITSSSPHAASRLYKRLQAGHGHQQNQDADRLESAFSQCSSPG